MAKARIYRKQVLKRKQALGFIETNVANGQIFWAVFTKKNGQSRKMVCRKGVYKHTKGGELGYNPAVHGLINVFDMQAGGYRNINVATIERVRINGVEYAVTD